MSPLTSLLVCVCVIVFCHIQVHGAPKKSTHHDVSVALAENLKGYEYLYILPDPASPLFSADPCKSMCAKANFVSCLKPTFVSELNKEHAGMYLAAKRKELHYTSPSSGKYKMTGDQVCYCLKKKTTALQYPDLRPKVDEVLKEQIKEFERLATWAHLEHADLEKEHKTADTSTSMLKKRKEILDKYCRYFLGLITAIDDVYSEIKKVQRNTITIEEGYMALKGHEKKIKELGKKIPLKGPDYLELTGQYRRVTELLNDSINQILNALRPFQGFEYKDLKHLQHECSKSLQLVPKGKRK